MTLALVKSCECGSPNGILHDIACPKHPDNAHATLAPSRAHRWLVCPGSQYVGDDPPTEWAALGTQKHAVLECVLSRSIVGGALVIAGDTLQTEAGPYVVPLEVLEQCHEIKEFIEQFHSTDHGGFVIETETRVEIGSHLWPNMPVGYCAGTVDAVAYGYEELLVLDAKFGFVHVEARGNPQLYLYALGLLAEIPFPIKRVTVCIAQPDYEGTVVFREHRITVEELMEWAFQQQHVVEEIQRGSRRLHAEDKACQWCPARASCPSRLQMVDDVANDEWMQSRSLEELLPFVPRLRAIAKDIEQRAMAELGQGKPVRGWKVVASKSRRKWQDDGVDGGLATEVGYHNPPEEFYARKLKSPAQMERHFYAHFEKTKTKKECKELVDKYTMTPTGAPKLAPESDPRPALEPATWTLEDALKASLEDFNGDE
jgi:hypothetical protein